MFLIADSGSTKADWAIVYPDGTKVLETHTTGLNPDLVSAAQVTEALQDNKDLEQRKTQFTQVYFYGAGCSRTSSNQIVHKALDAFFENARLVVDHDLVGAAYAAYRGTPTIACILGTGSNSCYFDGEKLTETLRSLFYILADEGSGNNIGKRIVQAYFLNKMPAELRKAFEERYELSFDDLYQNVYHSPLPNVYLASFSRFALDYKAEPFIQNIVYQSFMEFFINRVLPYRQAAECEVNFVGSVAYYYEHILRAVATHLNLKVGGIVKKPIDKLVEYHLKYIIPNTSV